MIYFSIDPYSIDMMKPVKEYFGEILVEKSNIENCLFAREDRVNHFIFK